MLGALRGFGGGLARLSRGFGPLLAGVWYLLIFWLSSRSGDRLPEPIGGSWAMNTAHALVFGLLALWMLVALPRADNWPRIQRRSAILVLVLVLLLGVLDEWHQASVPGRAVSALDVLTDLTGATCVIWICAYVGSAAAGERGLWLRLALGIAACAAAGALATLVDRTN